MVTDVLGAPVKRVEDPRFITGKGRYLDDIKLPGMAHVAILRSPYAHANIRSIDTQRGEGRARRPRGDRRRGHPVQPAADGLAGRRLGRASRTTSAPRGSSPPTRSSGRARASPRSSPRRRGQAQDALELIQVDWEPLPAVVDAEKATQPGAPQLHENAPNNVVFEWPVGDKDGTDAAFANAEVVVKQRLVNHRLIPNPMEVRGDIGWYNPGTDEYTVWMSSQTPHIQRLLLTAFVTGIPEHKVRCISPDVGGAFGSKIFCYADMALVMFASKLIGGRPVKWVEGRRESYGSHDPRPRPHHVRRGRREPRRRGPGARGSRRSPTSAAACRRSARASRPRSTAASSRGRTRSPTSTPRSPASTRTRRSWTPTAARAGPRRPTSSSGRWTSSRDELGIDPAEVRRRNFLPPDGFPYDNPSGLLTAVNGSKLFIDSGNYEPAMDKALAMAGYARPGGDEGRGEGARQAPRPRPLDLHRGVRRRALEVDRRGRRGLGRRDVGVVQHPGPPDRQGRGHDGHPAAGPGPRDDVRADHQPRAGHPDGGHRRPALATPRARRSATARTAPGRRTWAPARRSRPPARSARRPGATRRTCSRPRSRTSRSRAPSTASRARPRRRRRSRRSRSRSTSASTRPRAWSRTSTRRPTTTRPNCTFPFGTHIAIVEVDEETGMVDLVRYVAVDDVGKKINPMIVDGQLHGGIAQGVGQALWEEAVYDDDGQLLSGSMIDYALPRASWLPAFELDETVTPSARQPARRQGRRRGRLHRVDRGRRQRRHRRAQPARHPPPRHAVHRPEGVGRDAGSESARREARHDPGAVRVHPGRAASTRRSRLLAADDGAKVIAGGQSLLPLHEAAPRAAAARSSTSAGCRELARREQAGRRPAGRRRAHDLRGAHRLPGDPLRRRSRTRCRRSATSRCATGAPSAAPSPTRTRRRTCRRSLLALGAEVVLRSRRGTRTVAADGFFEGAVPDRGIARTSCSSRSGSRRAGGTTRAPRTSSLEQPASGYALVGVAAVVVVGAGGVVEKAGIGVTGVVRAPVPREGGRGRARSAPTASADAIAAAAANAVVGPAGELATSTPDSDYRAAMAVVYTRRAIEAALGGRLAASDVAPEHGGCGSSGSSRAARRPTRWPAPSSPATCRSRAAAWPRAAA